MKVSVIVTAYNYGLFLERCLRSLLEQSLPTTAYEIIVVDDASEDNTEDIMERYVEKYSNIRYIRNTKNVGVAESSNVAIREAFGQFIVRVDADDYVNKNFLLFLSAYLEANNGLLGVACDYVKVNNDEEVISRHDANEENISCGIMYRKDFLAEAGLYNSDFRHCEEKELRARLGNRYQVDHLKIPLYRYRIHGHNKTTNVGAVTEF